MSPFPFLQRESLAELARHFQLQAYSPVLELEGLEWRTGPVSTITGAMIINTIRCAAAESLLKRGVKPVVLPSHQFVGNTSASEQLEEFYEAYRKSLRHLFE